MSTLKNRKTTITNTIKRNGHGSQIKEDQRK